MPLCFTIHVNIYDTCFFFSLECVAKGRLIKFAFWVGGSWQVTFVAKCGRMGFSAMP
jgi:hypothetical protein